MGEFKKIESKRNVPKQWNWHSLISLLGKPVGDRLQLKEFIAFSKSKTRITVSHSAQYCDMSLQKEWI